MDPYRTNAKQFPNEISGYKVHYLEGTVDDIEFEVFYDAGLNSLKSIIVDLCGTEEYNEIKQLDYDPTNYAKYFFNSGSDLLLGAVKAFKAMGMFCNKDLIIPWERIVKIAVVKRTERKVTMPYINVKEK